MSKLTDQIRKYVSCPELGDKHYGKWGALTLEQRQNIAQICEYCNQQEKYADTFFKETQSLKHQLAEKDKEIEIVKENCNASIKFVREVQEKLTRHQVCEEIREKLDTVYGEPSFGLIYLENVKKLLDQIEQGESK